MSEQDYEGMMEGISRVFGPFTGKIIKGKIEVDIPPPMRPAGPLVGYGDMVEIGDWITVVHHGIKDAMPMQVVQYELRTDYPAISLLNRLRNTQFCYAEPGSMKPWANLTKVPLDDVPHYLREAYPRD